MNVKISYETSALEHNKALFQSFLEILNQRAFSQNFQVNYNSMGYCTQGKAVWLSAKSSCSYTLFFHYDLASNSFTYSVSKIKAGNAAQVLSSHDKPLTKDTIQRIQKYIDSNF